MSRPAIPSGFRCGSRRVFVCALALGLILLLAGCWSCPPELEEMFEDQISACAGHMKNRRLPLQAREVAQDNHDAWQQARYVATGREVSADVAERRNARRDADGPQ